MHIETIVVGEFQVNCFVVWGQSDKALVIDPGSDAELILQFLKQKKLTVAAYLVTHGHMDHICGLADLYSARPAPIGISEDDLEWSFSNANQMPPYYGVPKRPAEIARLLKDGQEWNDAGLAYKVISTPGHTPGAVCFHFEGANCLFTGDTLFAGSVGRTDLPGGSSRVLSASLKKLAGLPDATLIYPGHGLSSDIAMEKRTNYFMQAL
jgi:glyoxylase-like metal-dependent hydrolase (beta-lactamase superfamily II)